MMNSRIFENLKSRAQKLIRLIYYCGVVKPCKMFTFLEKIFCNEKPIVEINALISPTTSKDSSVSVAIATPVMIGIKLK